MVVLFLIDGLRPEAITPETMPHVWSLKEKGRWTLTARTVMPSSTLPCHMSLFHSVPPERHGIVTNTYTPPVRPVPGLFEVLQQARRRSAMFYNWEQLRDLARPGSLTVSVYRNMNEPGGDDSTVAFEATNELFDSDYDFAFVYLGDTDEEGHRFGWLSDEYLATATMADECIRQVMEALPAHARVFVTADHGGHDRTHGTDSPEDMTIPLIAVGEGVTSGTFDCPVSLMDIAPTILACLNLPAPEVWSGKVLAL
jgi:predicted AlkP superfamily pyrophosphatase or phosphodiesterase